ncbi:MAG: Flp pilus assembly protein CpaB [Methylobacterium mesophilicum]|nr:Flp pilus assembly protein CpaB [Methylobacterium mesophilicum]
MPASRIIILGVAATAAGGAGYVAKNMAAPEPMAMVEQAPQQPQIQLSDVLVLSADVPMGAPLGGQLSWESWPADGVATGFITKTDDPEAAEALKNAVARVPLYKGEPVRKAKLIGEGQSFLSAILPPGKRAVATQIAADTSAGGFILPNDYVDVIMTRRAPAATAGAAGDGFITETVLKNVKVLAIDQAIQEDEEGKRTKVGETATLELTPQQAEIITVARQMAERLTLALRSVSDSQEKVTGEADYLVSGAGRRGTVRLVKAGVMTEEGARK